VVGRLNLEESVPYRLVILNACVQARLVLVPSPSVTLKGSQTFLRGEGMARASFKIAPGIRISASSRGIRTSIGNGKARVSFGSGGTYTSAKIGGVRVSQSSSASTARRQPSRSSQPKRPSLAQLERAEKAAAAEAQIAELAALEKSLVTLHHEDFDPAEPASIPAPPGADYELIRSALSEQMVAGIGRFQVAERKAAKAQAAQLALAEKARLEAEWQHSYEVHCRLAQENWEKLLGHEPETVMMALEEAFADNASEATCVDVGTEEGENYATIVILFGAAQMVPERTPSFTPAGKPTTKKRTKADRNALYVSALASTVLATVKEGLAVAPSVAQFRVVVMRKDSGAATPADFLAPIYAGSFQRSALERVRWRDVDSVALLLTADEALFSRKGAAGDVMPISMGGSSGLQQLLEAFKSLVSKD
jgi:hypothetical protein